MDNGYPILIIALLIVLNGAFVAAEFAIIGTAPASVENRAAKGHRVARVVAAILRDPVRRDQYIATAQLGITFASLGLGMYGEHVLAEWFAGMFAAFGAAAWFPAHAAATVSSVALLTYLHIVLGEMVPKTLALRHAENTSLWITPAIMWVKTALYPLVVGLNSLGNAILRLFGIDRGTPSHNLGHTPEELEYLIEESQAGGALRAESGRLLRELLRFTELTAGEVMVPRVKVIGIPLAASPADLRSVLRGASFTRFPVYRKDLDEIVGVIHIKDLLPKLMSGSSIETGDLQPAPYVPHTAEVDVVLAAMRRETTQMAVVMDEYGGTAGIITAKDLFDEVAGELHEDANVPEIWPDPQGRLHVAGTVRIDEVAERLGREVEHDEVETVGGLVLSLLERPPRIGDAVIHQALRIEVTAVEKRGVKTCIITPAPDEPGRAMKSS
ncbi:MAG: HlyC/CorC family transporter [Bryobacterales bacterium]|nr:HlyC/CorC family transporter [Bryobacterales bacterium]